ncbi:hypothetical protein VC83_02194 [Pseudogymnoascus destructans]|uniref:AAA+ ATPase domain-containing protein n=1 Tax=Pseudogymnoascus destructans TaxID=655981 RepID=A0A177AI25_9PEZI|nr:uncharacterized protein VC83_02194 [Pseudogymnoascus destructans]OAF61440.1 hypothetical protein VC83_02194 [Pseudogymnoascus destructans]
MAGFFDLKARKKEAEAEALGDKKGAPNGKDNTRLQPWVEKYRPKSLADVTAQDHTITLPHMLYYGPPGTGKTPPSSPSPLPLRPALFHSRVLELNASDERGISIVRKKVKDFARMQLSRPPGGNYQEQYLCPPYKIIILDEADSMTQDAQSALRRTMETYSKITRFCLVCNYVTRIIDPLASRCSKFRFKRMGEGQAGTRLREIAEKEKVPMGGGVVEALIKHSEGDLRKAITFLQSAARLVGAAGADGGEEVEEDAMDVDGVQKVVTVKSIEDIAGVIPDRTIDSLVKAMQPSSSGLTYENISKVVTEMVADGWSASQVVTQLYQTIIYNESIADIHKNKIVMIFSEIDKRLADGADEHLSILDMALRIAGVLTSKA